MQVDDRNPSRQYGAWNQAFLQMLMSRGFMTGQDVFKGVKEIYERFKSNPKFPSVKVDTGDKQDVADLVEWFTLMANSNLEAENIPLRVKMTWEEARPAADSPHRQYYVLVPDSQDEVISKMQRVFGEPELEWLRLAAEHLIESEDGLGSPNDLTNLCRSVDPPPLRPPRNMGNNAAKKKLSVMEADRAMNLFLAEGYLQRVGGGKRTRVALGPRFMAELEGWLGEEDRPEGVWRCGKCDRVGMVGVRCSKRDCDTHFHTYHPNLAKCTRCKTVLAGLGEATKRSR